MPQDSPWQPQANDLIVPDADEENTLPLELMQRNRQVDKTGAPAASSA